MSPFVSIGTAVWPHPHGVVQVFAMTADDSIYTCWQVSDKPGATWSSRKGAPGKASCIASATVAPGLPQLFAVGSDGRVWTRWKVSTANGAPWTSWEPMPGTPDTVVHVAATPLPGPVGLVQVFATTAAGNIHTCWKVSAADGAPWTEWTSFPGQVSMVAAAVVVPGVPQLFAAGSDGRVWTCWKTSTTDGALWTAWEPMANSPGNVIHIATTPLPGPFGLVQIFVTTSDGTIHTCWKSSSANGAPWTPWVVFPGKVHMIAAATVNPGLPALFAVGSDGNLWTCRKASAKPGAPWTSWKFWPLDSFATLIHNGTTGTKLDLVILGDGFAWADQQKYEAAVDALLTDGIFDHDFFKSKANAFNVYRIDTVSHDSGVSEGTYVGGTLSYTTKRWTALDYVFTGDWNHGWLEESAVSRSRRLAALERWLPDYDLVMVLLNETGFGGVTADGVFVTTLGADWRTVAHEFGHDLGGLADEYDVNAGDPTKEQRYTGGEPGEPNITIDTDRETLKWRSHVASGTPVPTGKGADASYNQGTKPSTWNDNLSTGLFEGGGASFATGIYRPALECKMNSQFVDNGGEPVHYCSVCRGVMAAQVEPYLTASKGEGLVADDVRADGAAVQPMDTEVYVRVVVHCDGHDLSVVSASLVDGMLVQPVTLAPGLAYEVTDGRDRIAVGSMPTINLTRSLARPHAGLPHRQLSRTSFDFTVRLAGDVLAPATAGSPLTLSVLDVTPEFDFRLTSSRLSGHPGLTQHPVAGPLDLRPAVGQLGAAGSRRIPPQPPTP